MPLLRDTPGTPTRDLGETGEGSGLWGEDERGWGGVHGDGVRRVMWGVRGEVQYRDRERKLGEEEGG